MTNPANDLQIALQAARKGKETIQEYRKRKLQVDYKGKHDIVTDADVAAETSIVGLIREFQPGDEILAEESSDHISLPEGRVWIIDPIDGTTNFAYDFPIYCVSVALYIDGIPEVGVIIEVNLDEEFTAVRGEGAFLNGKPIRVSELHDPDKALIGTGFPYNDYSIVQDYFRLFESLIGEVQGIRRPGAAAYDLCCVAAGRFQGFYEYSLKAWDVAAGALIIQEAGGTVTDWKGGAGWLFGQRLVAGNPGIHAYLLRKISENISPDNLEW